MHAEVCELVVGKVHSLNTIIAVIYRPPNTRHQEFSRAMNEMDRILSDQSSPTPTFTLLGDFNFPAKDLEWHNVDGVLLPLVHNHREVDGTQSWRCIKSEAASLAPV